MKLGFSKVGKWVEVFENRVLMEICCMRGKLEKTV